MHSPLERRSGLLELAVLPANRPEPEVGLHLLRVQVEGGLERPLSLRSLPLSEEELAETGVSVGQLGVVLEGGLEGRLGL